MPFSNKAPKPNRRQIRFHYHTKGMAFPVLDRVVSIEPTTNFHTGSDVGIHCPFELVPCWGDERGQPIIFDHDHFPDLSQEGMEYMFYEIRESIHANPHLIARHDVATMYRLILDGSYMRSDTMETKSTIQGGFVLVWCDTTHFSTVKDYFVDHYAQKLGELLSGDSWDWKFAGEPMWESWGERLTEILRMAELQIKYPPPPLTPEFLQKCVDLITKDAGSDEPSAEL